MNDDAGKAPRTRPTLAEQIAVHAERKLKARRNKSQGVWFGLGMMGLVGWSVVVPTLIGAAVGIALDRHYPGRHSWTLALLIAGLVLGCFNAWHWILKEETAMQEDNGDRNE
ncbi:MAG: ATP synthase protein I [Candidatus Paceibacteria bacterium]|jgi:ATP synthase protein I